MIEQAPTSTPPESAETPKPTVIDVPKNLGLEEYAVQAATDLIESEDTSEVRRNPVPITDEAQIKRLEHERAQNDANWQRMAPPSPSVSVVTHDQSPQA